MRDLLSPVFPTIGSVESQQNVILMESDESSNVAEINESQSSSELQPGRTADTCAASERTIIRFLPAVHFWLSSGSISECFVRQLTQKINFTRVTGVIAALKQHAAESDRIAGFISAIMSEHAADSCWDGSSDAGNRIPNDVRSRVEVTFSETNIPSSLLGSPFQGNDVSMSADEGLHRLFDPVSSSDGNEKQ
jgi:hypothetical protein